MKVEGREGGQSVWDTRGSDKLNTDRQPESSSQSITFSLPLVSICLIDFLFLPVSRKPDSNDYSEFLGLHLPVKSTFWSFVFTAI